ncbi:STAS domain-containing protein [Streptomyces sp. NPDC002838]|uniref:STAS domain-containing protein n=1 Tax=Streptomyces sp. NPDC002838 TaxID=3154436 RepID=UPI00332BE0C9
MPPPTVIIRVRDLAQTPSHAWLAVSGTLGADTGRRLRHELGARIDRGHHELYLDLRELSCADGMTVEAVREAFALGATGRLHLIGAPERIRAALDQDPRITWHAEVAAAWAEWA